AGRLCEFCCKDSVVSTVATRTQTPTRTFRMVLLKVHLPKGMHRASLTPGSAWQEPGLIYASNAGALRTSNTQRRPPLSTRVDAIGHRWPTHHDGLHASIRR